jgi:hypothetical protein
MQWWWRGAGKRQKQGKWQGVRRWKREKRILSSRRKRWCHSLY